VEVFADGSRVRLSGASTRHITPDTEAVVKVLIQSP
jgi:hypothetical protein